MISNIIITISNILITLVVIELASLLVLRISTHKRTQKWITSLNESKIQTNELIKTIGGFTRACDWLKKMREENKKNADIN